MNPHRPGKAGAFTLVEMLTVIAIIAMLAALLLPVLSIGELRGKRIVCINNLQQIGLAFHAFSNDHSGKFPMALSTNDGGSLEYVQSGFDSGPVFYTAYCHFQVLSNELVFPRILVCPMDITRPAATNFAALQNQNLSYFIGVYSTFDKPESIIAGDRNLATNSWFQPTILQLGPEGKLWWTWELHQHKGDMLFADGHVDQWNNSSFGSGEDSSAENQTFFLPSVMLTNGPLTAASPPRSQPSSPYYANDTFSARTPRPASELPPATPTSPTVVSQAKPVVAAADDSDAGMSDFNRNLTHTLRHDVAWGYFWLWLLLLLYIAYRIWKWYRERDAKLRAEMARHIPRGSDDDDSSG